MSAAPTKTADPRLFLWPAAVLLLAPALLAGHLLGAQIGNQYGGFAVFGGMERAIAATFEPLDVLGMGRVVREAMESVSGK